MSHFPHADIDHYETWLMVNNERVVNLSGTPTRKRKVLFKEAVAQNPTATVELREERHVIEHRAIEWREPEPTHD